MTRAEIAAELDKVACEWRVPLEKLQGAQKRGGEGKSRLVVAARAVFLRKMFAEGVDSGHVAWALKIARRNANIWYRVFRKAEERWWTA